MSTEKRAGADRRLTFTQSPFAADYADTLNELYGVSKADTYNTAIKVLSAVISATRTGAQVVIRTEDGGKCSDYGLDALIGDIVVSMGGGGE